MASSDCQDKPQRGRPKRAELLDVVPKILRGGFLLVQPERGTSCFTTGFELNGRGRC